MPSPPSVSCLRRDGFKAGLQNAGETCPGRWDGAIVIQALEFCFGLTLHPIKISSDTPTKETCQRPTSLDPAPFTPTLSPSAPLFNHPYVVHSMYLSGMPICMHVYIGMLHVCVYIYIFICTLSLCLSLSLSPLLSVVSPIKQRQPKVLKPCGHGSQGRDQLSRGLSTAELLAKVASVSALALGQSRRGIWPSETTTSLE